MSETEFPAFPQAAPEGPTPIGEILQESPGSAPSSSDGGSAPPPESDERGGEQPGAWTYAALKDERTKRQVFQKRAAELEAENQALMTSLSNPSDQPSGVSDDFWANPEAHLQAVERSANLRASSAELVAEHGREALNALEQGIEYAMQKGHPDLPLLSEAMRRSSNPVAVAFEWFKSQGGQVPRQQSASVFPSNLAGARNVGRRSGPGFAGPTPLQDIFDRRRPSAK